MTLGAIFGQRIRGGTNSLEGSLRIKAMLNPDKKLGGTFVHTINHMYMYTLPVVHHTAIIRICLVFQPSPIHHAIPVHALVGTLVIPKGDVRVGLRRGSIWMNLGQCARNEEDELGNTGSS